jgi:hypothetical protein
VYILVVDHVRVLELTRTVDLVVAGVDMLRRSFAVLYISKNVVNPQTITYRYLLVS